MTFKMEDVRVDVGRDEVRNVEWMRLIHIPTNVKIEFSSNGYIKSHMKLRLIAELKSMVRYHEQRTGSIPAL